MYSLRCSVPHGTSSTRVCTTSTLRSRSRIASASARVGGHVAGHLDRHRQRRLLLHPGRRRRDQDVAADLRRELVHHLPHGRGEHVHAAHDQHVVGAADAAHPRPGAAARACAGAHRDVVARAEPQQRGGLVGEVRQHQLAACAVVHRNGRPRLRVDQLRMDETACAQVHAVLVLALAPQRDAQVADAHRLGHPRSPAPLQQLAEGRLAAAGLARDQHPPHALGGQVDAAIGRPLDQVGGVGRRQHRRLRLAAAGSPASGARCCRCRPGCGRGRCGRTRPALHRPRTARRCRWTRSAGRRRCRRRRSSGPTRSPSCQDRKRSAGCSWECRWFRWWSRCARSAHGRRRGARRSGWPR